MKRIRFGYGKEIEADSSASADLVEVEPGVYSLLRESRVDEVRIVRSPSGYTASVGGWNFELEVIDPRDRRSSASAGGGEGRQRILAPMPGKVVRVLVALGDPVRAGQGVVVVEAMKMQNEMKASKAGTVVEIRVESGGTVAAGDVLAIVE